MEGEQNLFISSMLDSDCRDTIIFDQKKQKAVLGH